MFNLIPIPVLPLRGRGHLLVLLEHCLLLGGVPAGTLAQGAQEELQEEEIKLHITCEVKEIRAFLNHATHKVKKGHLSEE